MDHGTPAPVEPTRATRQDQTIAPLCQCAPLTSPSTTAPATATSAAGTSSPTASTDALLEAAMAGKNRFAALQRAFNRPATITVASGEENRSLSNTPAHKDADVSAATATTAIATTTITTSDDTAPAGTVGTSSGNANFVTASASNGGVTTSKAVPALAAGMSLLDRWSTTATLSQSPAASSSLTSDRPAAANSTAAATAPFSGPARIPGTVTPNATPTSTQANASGGGGAAAGSSTIAAATVDAATSASPSARQLKLYRPPHTRDDLPRSSPPQEQQQQQSHRRHPSSSSAAGSMTTSPWLTAAPVADVVNVQTSSGVSAARSPARSTPATPSAAAAATRTALVLSPTMTALPPPVKTLMSTFVAESSTGAADVGTAELARTLKSTIRQSIHGPTPRSTVEGGGSSTCSSGGGATNAVTMAARLREGSGNAPAAAVVVGRSARTPEGEPKHAPASLSAAVGVEGTGGEAAGSYLAVARRAWNGTPTSTPAGSANTSGTETTTTASAAAAAAKPEGTAKAKRRKTSSSKQSVSVDSSTMQDASTSTTTAAVKIANETRAAAASSSVEDAQNDDGKPFKRPSRSVKRKRKLRATRAAAAVPEVEVSAEDEGEYEDEVMHHGAAVRGQAAENRTSGREVAEYGEDGQKSVLRARTGGSAGSNTSEVSRRPGWQPPRADAQPVLSAMQPWGTTDYVTGGLRYASNSTHTEENNNNVAEYMDGMDSQAGGGDGGMVMQHGHPPYAQFYPHHHNFHLYAHFQQQQQQQQQMMAMMGPSAEAAAHHYATYNEYGAQMDALLPEAVITAVAQFNRAAVEGTGGSSSNRGTGAAETMSRASSTRGETVLSDDRCSQPTSPLLTAAAGPSGTRTSGLHRGRGAAMAAAAAAQAQAHAQAQAAVSEDGDSSERRMSTTTTTISAAPPSQVPVLHPPYSGSSPHQHHYYHQNSQLQLAQPTMLQSVPMPTIRIGTAGTLVHPLLPVVKAKTSAPTATATAPLSPAPVNRSTERAVQPSGNTIPVTTPAVARAPSEDSTSPIASPTSTAAATANELSGVPRHHHHHHYSPLAFSSPTMPGARTASSYSSSGSPTTVPGSANPSPGSPGPQHGLPAQAPTETPSTAPQVPLQDGNATHQRTNPLQLHPPNTSTSAACTGSRGVDSRQQTAVHADMTSGVETTTLSGPRASSIIVTNSGGGGGGGAGRYGQPSPQQQQRRMQQQQQQQQMAMHGGPYIDPNFYPDPSAPNNATRSHNRHQQQQHHHHQQPGTMPQGHSGVFGLESSTLAAPLPYEDFFVVFPVFAAACLTLQPADEANREQLCWTIEAVLRRCLTEKAELRVHGSITTGLALPSSDIDVLVVAYEPMAPLVALQKVSQALLQLDEEGLADALGFQEKVEAERQVAASAAEARSVQETKMAGGEQWGPSAGPSMEGGAVGGDGSDGGMTPSTNTRAPTTATTVIAALTTAADASAAEAAALITAQLRNEGSRKAFLTGSPVYHDKHLESAGDGGEEDWLSGSLSTRDGDVKDDAEDSEDVRGHGRRGLQTCTSALRSAVAATTGAASVSTMTTTSAAVATNVSTMVNAITAEAATLTEPVRRRHSRAAELDALNAEETEVYGTVDDVEQAEEVFRGQIEKDYSFSTTIDVSALFTPSLSSTGGTPKVPSSPTTRALTSIAQSAAAPAVAIRPRMTQTVKAEYELSTSMESHSSSSSSLPDSCMKEVAVVPEVGGVDIIAKAATLSQHQMQTSKKGATEGDGKAATVIASTENAPVHHEGASAKTSTMRAKRTSTAADLPSVTATTTTRAAPMFAPTTTNSSNNNDNRHAGHLSFVPVHEGRYFFVQSITGTRVPVIKLTDKATGTKVDITFAGGEHWRSMQLTRSLLDTFPQSRQLILFLKFCVRGLGIGESEPGGVSSFTLYLMVRHFYNECRKRVRVILAEREAMAAAARAQERAKLAAEQEIIRTEARASGDGGWETVSGREVEGVTVTPAVEGGSGEAERRSSRGGGGHQRVVSGVASGSGAQQGSSTHDSPTTKTHTAAGVQPPMDLGLLEHLLSSYLVRMEQRHAQLVKQARSTGEAPSGSPAAEGGVTTDAAQEARGDATTGTVALPVEQSTSPPPPLPGNSPTNCGSERRVVSAALSAGAGAYATIRAAYTNTPASSDRLQHIREKILGFIGDSSETIAAAAAAGVDAAGDLKEAASSALVTPPPVGDALQTDEDDEGRGVEASADGTWDVLRPTHLAPPPHHYLLKTVEPLPRERQLASSPAVAGEEGNRATGNVVVPAVSSRNAAAAQEKKQQNSEGGEGEAAAKGEAEATAATDGAASPPPPSNQGEASTCPSEKTTTPVSPTTTTTTTNSHSTSASGAKSGEMHTDAYDAFAEDFLQHQVAIADVFLDFFHYYGCAFDYETCGIRFAPDGSSVVVPKPSLCSRRGQHFHLTSPFDPEYDLTARMTHMRDFQWLCWWFSEWGTARQAPMFYDQCSLQYVLQCVSPMTAEADCMAVHQLLRGQAQAAAQQAANVERRDVASETEIQGEQIHGEAVLEGAMSPYSDTRGAYPAVIPMASPAHSEPDLHALGLAAGAAAGGGGAVSPPLGTSQQPPKPQQQQWKQPQQEIGMSGVGRRGVASGRGRGCQQPVYADMDFYAHSPTPSMDGTPQAFPRPQQQQMEQMSMPPEGISRGEVNSALRRDVGSSGTRTAAACGTSRPCGGVSNPLPDPVPSTRRQLPPATQRQPPSPQHQQLPYVKSRELIETVGPMQESIMVSSASTAATDGGGRVPTDGDVQCGDKVKHSEEASAAKEDEGTYEDASLPQHDEGGQQEMTETRHMSIGVELRKDNRLSDTSAQTSLLSTMEDLTLHVDTNETDTHSRPSDLASTTARQESGTEAGEATEVGIGGSAAAVHGVFKTGGYPSPQNIQQQQQQQAYGGMYENPMAFYPSQRQQQQQNAFYCQAYADRNATYAPQQQQAITSSMYNVHHNPAAGFYSAPPSMIYPPQHILYQPQQQQPSAAPIVSDPQAGATRSYPFPFLQYDVHQYLWQYEQQQQQQQRLQQQLYSQMNAPQGMDLSSSAYRSVADTQAPTPAPGRGEGDGSSSSDGAVGTPPTPTVLAAGAAAAPVQQQQQQMYAPYPMYPNTNPEVMWGVAQPLPHPNTGNNNTAGRGGRMPNMMGGDYPAQMNLMGAATMPFVQASAMQHQNAQQHQQQVVLPSQAIGNSGGGGGRISQPSRRRGNGPNSRGTLQQCYGPYAQQQQLRNASPLGPAPPSSFLMDGAADSAAATVGGQPSTGDEAAVRPVS